MGSPPEDTYSVTVHPQRFAPLVEVARALREHVVATYDVSVDGDRLLPADPQAAPLTIEIHDFPMVEVRAGVAGHERFPVCGCDACDDDVEQLMADLEDFVLAVVGGGFHERWVRGGLGQSWNGRDGERSSWGKQGDRAIRRALKQRGRGAVWQPWPAR